MPGDIRRVGAAAQPAAGSSTDWGLRGKYREIVLAVACFLLFDLAVLVMNFVVSYEIAKDAAGINLAGRQRMLSQRIAKSLYELNATDAPNAPALLEELHSTVQLFDQTLDAFERGGMVSGSAGQRVQLEAVKEPALQQLVQQARTVWRPLHAAAQAVVRNPASSRQRAVAVALARQENLELLRLMNALTTALDAHAQDKATRLRWIQTGGITLALLNFLFILFKFLRRLREGDRKLEAAQQETSEILATVDEGLFLLDKDLCMGSQFSAATARMLGHAPVQGEDFGVWLSRQLDERECRMSRDYLCMMFQDRVLEALLAELNPMQRVKVTTAGGAPRWLSFRFNPVRKQGQLQHLLVSVQDVTEQVRLTREVRATRTQARDELGVVLGLLDANPLLLTQFLDNAKQTLDHAVQRLAQAEAEHLAHAVDLVVRNLQSLSGDAAMLALDGFGRDLQTLELALRDVLEQAADGLDLPALMRAIDACHARIEQAAELLARLQRFRFTSRDEAAADASPVFVRALEDLGARLADGLGKRVLIRCDLSRLEELDARRRQCVRDVLVQCVRNAVTHGVETSAERALLGKSQLAQIDIRVVEDEGELLMECRDDGRGIDPRRVREALLRSGRYTEPQLDELDARHILLKLFEPGVSTALRIDSEAGQGMGMELVLERVKQLGAQLRLVSQPGDYTCLSLRFPL